MPKIRGGGDLPGLCCAHESCRPVPACVLASRSLCEASYIPSNVTRPRPGGRHCVWLGGACVEGVRRDCPETVPTHLQTSFYGEQAAFEQRCNLPHVCPSFQAAFVKYAAMHEAATRDALPAGASPRLLVVTDHWRNVGMGFMPSHVANLLLFAMSSNLLVYFENYGRYDWTRYFTGYAGLDARWTAAKRRLWAERFGRRGVSELVIDVLHEDDHRKGDDDWEEHLSAALANASTPWILIDGQATTVNWNRILAPALPRAIANARATPGGAPPPLDLPLARGGRRYDLRYCEYCAIWAMYRPRRVLARRLARSPVADGAPLACFRARTMYAEDKRFFPDSLPHAWGAVDALWQSYDPKKMLADDTFWGPRPRLRCANRTAEAAEAPRGQKPLVLPGAAVGCMEEVRAALGSAARVFVAVDAPLLQQLLFESFGARAFITPGVGVDPTNEYRDKKGPQRGVELGRQDLAERNLIKVSLDYYLQGFCLASLTLRPSAFYGAATLRTAALRPALVDNVTATQLASPAWADAFSGRHAPCLGPLKRFRNDKEANIKNVDTCVKRVCGLHSCNAV